MPVDAERASLESTVGSALAKFVLAISRRRWLVLSFSLVLFMASPGITIRDLGIHSDENELFPDDLPFRLLDEGFFEAFPHLHENIVTWADDRRDLLCQVIYASPRLDYGSMAVAEGVEGVEGASLLATSTARAVVFSALTTIASFGSLALVPHLGLLRRLHRTPSS